MRFNFLSSFKTDSLLYVDNIYLLSILASITVANKDDFALQEIKYLNNPYKETTNIWFHVLFFSWIYHPAEYVKGKEKHVLLAKQILSMFQNSCAMASLYSHGIFCLLQT
jgi:hypothetical protein